MRLELARALTQAFEQYRIAYGQIELFRKGLLRQAHEAVEIARKSYQFGEISLLELLDAQRVAFQTTREFYQAQVALATALEGTALAACVGAGLWGIEKNLKLKEPPLSGDAAKAAKMPRLPRNLMEATANLKRSKPARELFGEVFVDHFVRTREWEWRQFQDAVTDWELRRYFEII